MNSIIKTTEVAIDSKPKRNGNAKPVFCITDGRTFASVKDAAIFYGSHMCNISQACLGKIRTSNGKEFCFVKDLPIRVLDVGSHIQSLLTDATAYREMKAKEEVERKRTERIAEIKERREELATEMDALYEELIELESEIEVCI
jgi:hypothetical protein